MEIKNMISIIQDYCYNCKNKIKIGEECYKIDDHIVCNNCFSKIKIAMEKNKKKEEINEEIAECKECQNKILYNDVYHLVDGYIFCNKCVKK